MLPRTLARTGSVNILIVDDDRSTQRFLADALTKRGYVVTVERDGEWALRTFEKKPFDAVILDLLLPALSGYEVATQLRALPRGKRVPLIMISGVYKSGIHKREAVEKHGAVALLEKPLDLATLHATLAKALGDRAPKKKKVEPPPPPVEEDEVTGELMADVSQQEEVAVVERQARAGGTGGHQSMRGDLSRKPFAELLAECHRWRATGALLLRRGKVKKIVYFRDGTPQLVKSNLLVECLGRVLVREKLISEAECEASIKRMKSTGRMQGTVLIEMGCISPHNLQYALQVQLQEKLYDLFRWESGDYQFNPKASQPPEPISLGLSSAQLIHLGVRRSYDAPRLAKALAGADDKYVHPSDEPLTALQDAGLSDEEKALLSLADGHKKVSTLRAVGVLDALDTDRLLYAMRCAQLVDFRDEPAKGKARASIAKLAERAARPPPLPVPVPAAPPLLPPPLPPRAAKSQGLALPWDSAPVGRPAGAAVPPPPPNDALEPPRKKPAQAPARRSLLPELSVVVNVPGASSEESMLREHLAAKMAAMRRLDYFEILGVKRSAPREDVKRAYFALAKEYHPERHFDHASAELRQLAQQLYELISTAHDTLTDPTERARYTAELEAGKKRDLGGDVGKILAAEGKFQKGEELLRAQQLAEAHQAFLEAISLYPDEGEFHAYLGWSLFQLRPDESERAVAAIEQGVALNPKLDKSYLFLGYIYQATGRPDRAEKQFEKAIQCNPDCTEALRELRLLGRSKR